MSGRWVSPHALPPFLTGAGLAIAGEVAVGLLLYGGPGFIPALSVILAVLLLSLGAGVWVGAGTGGALEAIRLRWLLALVAVSVGAVFAGLWEVFRGFGATALTQGVGLALLGALPMYGGGVVLGALQATSGRRLRGGSGPSALVGAAVGVVVAGHLFFPGLSPTAVLLLCLMALSAAALLHGRALDREVSVEGSAIRERAGRRVRVERWVRGRPPLARIAILEGERVRVVTGEKGQAVRPEEMLMDQGLVHWVPRMRRALVLGGGAGGVARRLAARDEGPEVRLLDPNGALLDAVASDLPLPETKRFATHTRSIAELLHHGSAPETAEPWDLIILEWSERSVAGLLDRFPSETLERVRTALSPSGTLILYPLATDPDRGEEGLLTLARDVGRGFSRTALYVARRDPGVQDEVPSEHLPPGRHGGLPAQERMAVLVAGSGEAPPWPGRLREFLEVPVRDEASGAARPPL